MDVGAIVQQQNVNVGVREQLKAGVAAHCEQRDWRLVQPVLVPLLDEHVITASAWARRAKST
jgi:hypothetical protein